MNIEQAFIKSAETERVVEVVKERLNGRLRDIRLCYQMAMQRYLNEKKIYQPLYIFREVVRERGNGWEIVQARNNDN